MSELRPQDAFSEFREDGWPLCPACGEDELWQNIDAIAFPRVPSLQERIENIVGCYHCGWTMEEFLAGKKP